MKVLLIGKFPPMQGGVSAKTYWLYKAMEKKGYNFKIVTVRENDYSLKGGSDRDDPHVTIVEDKKIPWHIPETGLLDDRLLNAALKAAADFEPDLIETNYLWPFGKDALLVSHLLKKPLLIRHAGSDLHKFAGDEEFLEIMRLYFNYASAIATHETAPNLINQVVSKTGKGKCLKRYIPDPEIFKPDTSAKNFDILFAGKVNYHWRLKGIKLLLEIIERKGLKALFLIGGKYKGELLDLIGPHNLGDRFKISDFVHPEEMPSIYNSCKFVWCWEEQGTIEDFSNVLWEALFCHIPCIINSEVSRKIEKEGIPANFTDLLHLVNAQTLMDFPFIRKTEYGHPTDNQNLKVSLFEDYLENNIALYKGLV